MGQKNSITARFCGTSLKSKKKWPGWCLCVCVCSGLLTALPATKDWAASVLILERVKTENMFSSLIQSNPPSCPLSFVNASRHAFVSLCSDFSHGRVNFYKGKAALLAPHQSVR